MNDTNLARAANELAALAKTCPDNDNVQEKYWNFIIENIDALLRLALIGARINANNG